MATKQKRRSWLAAEIKAVKTGAKNLIPTRKLARLLKRTEGAIRQKALTLGLSLNVERRGKAKTKKVKVTRVPRRK